MHAPGRCGAAATLRRMSRTSTSSLRVVSGPKDAAPLSAAATDPDVAAVLVHDGVDLADGAAQRLLAELSRPGRRVVRVACAPARCVALDRELLAAALVAVPVEQLLAAGDDLDARLAQVLGLDPDASVTDVADLTTGAWRHWVDGEAVGVRAHGAATPQWQAAVRRAHSPARRARTRARQVLGGVRRGLSRRRDRRSQER